MNMRKILGSCLVLGAIFLSSCAGSKGGAGGDTGGDTGSTEAAPAEPALDSAKVKAAEDEAYGAVKKNNERRREIFELKTKLGMDTNQEPEAVEGPDAPAEKSADAPK